MTPHWTPPTPEEVADLRARYGLKQQDLADLGRVCLRQVERYEAPDGTASHRKPSRAVWELILVKLGEQPLDTSIRKKARRRAAR